MQTSILASNPRITYSPQNTWILGADGNATTTSAGATAQLTFDGVFVRVFGEISFVNNRTTPPVSTYALDGATPVVCNASDFRYFSGRHKFFQASGLANGSHSIVITAVNNQTDFSFRTIVFGSTIESASTHMMKTIRPTPSATPTGTGAGAVASPIRIPVSAIVGAVIPTSVVLLVVDLVFYYRYRRRRMPTAPGSAPDIPKPSLRGSSERHTNNAGTALSQDSCQESNVSTSFSMPSEDEDVNSESSGDAVVWGSFPHSVSITSTVVGDRSETGSFVDEL